MEQTDFGDEVFKQCHSEEQPSSPPSAYTPSPQSTPSESSSDEFYVICIFVWVAACLFMFS